MEIVLNRECFTTSYPPYSALRVDMVSKLFQKKQLNLYIHIPYCVQKCDFCYYSSQVPKNKLALDTYVESVVKEIELICSQNDYNNHIVETIYFGGGTPTILGINHFLILFTAIKKHFNISDNVEICCEARPGGNITSEKMKFLKEQGVSRISFGVQSLNDEILTVNGRHHTVEQFYKSYNIARTAGIEWINCDLMSGMIADSLSGFINTIEKMIEVKPENISIYKMELFYNTKLYKRIKNDKYALNANKIEIEQAREAQKRLREAGYFMQNNSLFIKEKKYTHLHRYNVQYSQDMLGIGASAISHIDNKMFQNIINVDEYEKKVKENKIPIGRAVVLDQNELIRKYLILAMKNLRISKEEFYKKFGFHINESFLRGTFYELINRGYLLENSNDYVVNEEYALFADDIARSFYSEKAEIKMETHVKRDGEVIY